MRALGQSSLQAASSPVLNHLAQPCVTHQYHKANQFESKAALAGLTDFEATLDERGSGRRQFSYFCSVLM